MHMDRRSVSGLNYYCGAGKQFMNSPYHVVDPPDDILEASLRKYVQRGLTQKEKIQRLAADHGLAIGCVMSYGYLRN